MKGDEQREVQMQHPDQSEGHNEMVKLVILHFIWFLEGCQKVQMRVVQIVTPFNCEIKKRGCDFEKREFPISLLQDEVFLRKYGNLGTEGRALNFHNIF